MLRVLQDNQTSCFFINRGPSEFQYPYFPYFLTLSSDAVSTVALESDVIGSISSHTFFCLSSLGDEFSLDDESYRLQQLIGRF